MTRLELAGLLLALAEDRLATCESQIKMASKISTPMWKAEAAKAQELVEFAKSIEGLVSETTAECEAGQ